MGARVRTKEFQVKTTRENQMVDITADVKEAVSASGVSNGVATVFVLGSTAAITTIEYEPGLKEDFPAMLERVAPKAGVEYKHHRKWHDENGHSHVKASLVGPSLSVPVLKGELALGEWQQIVLVEFDVRPRNRRVVLQIIGDP